MSWQVVSYFHKPVGWVKKIETSKNIKRYYAPKHLTRDSDKCTDERGRAWQLCVHRATFTANRFSAVQIALQCRWILVFGRYSLQLDNNIHYLIIFHVKTVTRMARTLARMNRMARSVTRMARTVARTVTRMARTVTRMARWLAH